MPTSTARTVVVLTGMFLAVALVFAGIVGFLAIGTSISKVTITSGSPECTGTMVSSRREAIELRPGMRCTVSVTVHNPGRLAIRLEEMVLPSMGSQGSSAVQVRAWDGRAPERAGINAAFDVDRRLEPGDSWETEVHYEFRPAGCTDPGTHSATLAEVEASAWGRTVRVRRGSVLFDGTAESEC